MTETPPWWIDPWELPTDLAKITQQWSAIRSVLEDGARFDLSDPEVSGWSCGQHAGHSVLVAQHIADRIEENLAEPERDRDRRTEELATRVLAAGHFARGVAKAPRDVDPAGRGREAFLSLLPAAVASWERIEARRRASRPPRAQPALLPGLSDEHRVGTHVRRPHGAPPQGGP